MELMFTDEQIEFALQTLRPRPVAVHEAGHLVACDEFDLDPVPYVVDACNGMVLYDHSTDPLQRAIVGWSGIVAECVLNSKMPNCVRPEIDLRPDTIDEWLAAADAFDISRSDFESISLVPARVGLQASLTLLTQRKSDLLRTACMLDSFFDNRLDAKHPLAQQGMDAFPKLVAAYKQMGQRRFIEGGQAGRIEIAGLIVGTKDFLSRLDGRQSIDRAFSMSYARNELTKAKAWAALQRVALQTQKG